MCSATILFNNIRYSFFCKRIQEKSRNSCMTSRTFFTLLHEAIRVLTLRTAFALDFFVVFRNYKSMARQASTLHRWVIRSFHSIS